MIIMDKNFDIADCIVAFIKGIATPEQMVRLDVWLEESDENRRLLASLLDESVYEQRREEWGQLELNESFENVRKERNGRVRLRNMRRIAVAASVLLLVTVGGYLVRKRGSGYRRAFPANDGNGRKRTGFTYFVHG